MAQQAGAQKPIGAGAMLFYAACSVSLYAESNEFFFCFTEVVFRVVIRIFRLSEFEAAFFNQFFQAGIAVSVVSVVHRILPSNVINVSGFGVAGQ
jgi:hypothetical protein